MWACPPKRRRREGGSCGLCSRSAATSSAPIWRRSVRCFETTRAIAISSIPRNRVRHELLPLLSRDFSPGITDVLAREATIARQDEDRLQQEAIDLLDLIVLRNETGISGEAAVELDARALSALHPALAVRVARIAMETVAPGRFVGFDHVERLLALARDPRGEGALSLPGQHAVRRGETLVLDAQRAQRSRRADAQPFSNSFRVSLSIPGEVVLAPQGWAVSATQCARTDADPGGDTQPGQSPGTLKVECPRAGTDGGGGQADAAAGGPVPEAGRPVEPARDGRASKESAGRPGRSKSAAGGARFPAPRCR